MNHGYKYQWFHNLDSEGLEATLEEYTSGDALKAQWRVHTIIASESFEHPEDTSYRGTVEVQRFSILLERPQFYRPDPPPRPDPILPDPSHRR